MVPNSALSISIQGGAVLGAKHDKCTHQKTGRQPRSVPRFLALRPPRCGHEWGLVSAPLSAPRLGELPRSAPCHTQLLAVSLQKPRKMQVVQVGGGAPQRRQWSTGVSCAVILCELFVNRWRGLHFPAHPHDSSHLLPPSLQFCGCFSDCGVCCYVMFCPFCAGESAWLGWPSLPRLRSGCTTRRHLSPRPSRAAGEVAKAAGRDYCMTCCVVPFFLGFMWPCWRGCEREALTKAHNIDDGE